MGNSKIKYYPVGNGDTTLLTLSDNTTILIDCDIRQCEKDSDGNQVYNVKEDLLMSLQKRNNIPFVDLFVLTHPDKDHCCGFKKNFYKGDPNDYNESNRKNDEIIIDEIWVTSLLFTTEQCDDANSIRGEVNRRKRLNNGISKDRRGNRLRLIGYDDDSKFEGVESIIPGTEIFQINNKAFDAFSIFIHAPFKKDLVTCQADGSRNSSSIVLQTRFNKQQTYAIFGGDSDHYIWEKIIEISEKNNRSEYLKWDLFLAPHHCSWTFFNNVPYDDKPENKKPKEYSLKLLTSYRQIGGRIISSSKKVLDGLPNPPHKEAKDEYIRKVTSSGDFYELAIIPNEKSPEPVEFIITENGITKSTEKAKVAITSAGAGGAASTVVKNGNDVIQ